MKVFRTNIKSRDFLFFFFFLAPVFSLLSNRINASTGDPPLLAAGDRFICIVPGYRRWLPRPAFMIDRFHPILNCRLPIRCNVLTRTPTTIQCTLNLNRATCARQRAPAWSHPRCRLISFFESEFFQVSSLSSFFFFLFLLTLCQVSARVRWIFLLT